jgi:hypothetical protein
MALSFTTKFRAGEKGDQEEGTAGGLCTNIGMNVCEAEKDWMGGTVAGHHRDVGLVGGEDDAKKCRSVWKYFLWGV